MDRHMSKAHNTWIYLYAYRANDRPLVVEDGNTTGSSSVSIEVIWPDYTRVESRSIGAPSDAVKING